MKRKLFSGILAAALCLLPILPVSAGATTRSVPIQVDGTLLSLSGDLRSGATYVALRSLLDAFGGWTLTWNSSNDSAVASGEGHTITASPEADTVTVDGRTYSGSVYVKNGRTFVPLRTTAAACGAAVEWDKCLGGAAVTSSGAKYNAVDLYWLAHIISAESQGESLTGQIAVGNVVLNRVKAPQFPNTIPGVVFDRVDGVQFQPVSLGTVFDVPTDLSVTAAKRALDGEKPVGKALYFYAPALSQGLWINANRTYYMTIGCHRFYL